jgi:hypothetical protein
MLAAKLRAMHKVGSRTMDNRDKGSLRALMLHDIAAASCNPGYFAGDTQEALKPAWTALCAYDKHVLGHRIDPSLAEKIREMSPHTFAGFLGGMVDSGCTNVGEFEQYFAYMARIHRAAVKA